MVEPTRGVLYPARLPQFHRLPPPADAAELVEWCWIPEWDIEPGRSSRQELVSFPALNVVVEGSGTVLSGATTRASSRDLTGRGWAVGALLRPAAVAALTETPIALLDRVEPFDAPGLPEAVAHAMAPGEGHRERAVAVLCAWLRDRVGEVTAPQRHANAMARLLMSDPSVRTPEQAAARLAVSVRTLQRMAHRHVGLSPAAIIRRRRLQEAAERIRTDPDTDLATVAAELGYADQAHLANDFRAVLGITASSYRAGADPGRS
ncbi:helix-turn-helix domain-containing protein [Microbacterium azadirachtae]|uniref:helix-turn-helix domain-containing protein n=1 Tax=Microbacterium azadirachtae TaxID=582680 RepID=UPI00087EE266|nr:helix-turn-helix domain-containing protein [Microbacterium azadirachtae]SDM01805.1 Helix-turn-helix domain-containing protein [Microbacterium azadirachtae]SEG27392.1 Helix-turn-helix domain-containing protein [Microbacterium azadirachtae]SEG30407.1 Helix-turn-helix domain-containing protein [Microbacterium azadirachtae]